MVIWKCKSCRRCGGDMFVERDLDGWYEQCLQCSYRYELRSLGRVKEYPARTDRQIVKAGRR